MVEEYRSGYGVGNGDSIDEMLERLPGEKPKRFLLTKNDLLLDRAPKRSPSAGKERTCGNSPTWPRQWARFDMDWLRFKVDVDHNFLNTLAGICKGAKLLHCEKNKCTQRKYEIEAAAPPCSWEPFRDWAIQAITCQLGISKKECKDPAHVHIASAIGLCYTLLEWRYHEDSTIEKELLGPGGSRTKMNVIEVVDIIYWMMTVQAKIGYNIIPDRWPDNFIPKVYLQPAIEKAEDQIQDLRLCRYRTQNFVNASVRKSAELPALIQAANRPDMRHHGHEKCTAVQCKFVYYNRTGKEQAHTYFCDRKCERWKVTREKLRKPIESETPAVTSLYEKDTILSPKVRYIAISHVWADGTGGIPQPKKRKGEGPKERDKRFEKESRFTEVNFCYLKYFRRIAKRLSKSGVPEITGIWWDALSNPMKWGKGGKEDGLRSTAIGKMHLNYQRASYTIVHDKYLLGFKYRGPEDDHSACLALVLSPWFTRGWTALELNVSHNVIVLLGGGHDGTPVLKRLEDILPNHPAFTLRAHWIASILINKVWKSIRNISDILTLLHPRGTSWPEDMRLISALLIGWEKKDDEEDTEEYDEESQETDEDEEEAASYDEEEESIKEMESTKGILLKSRKILNSALLHGFETIQRTGPFSWCPKALKDMPAGSTDDFDDGGAELTINSDGSIEGEWYYRFLESTDTKNGALTRYESPICKRFLSRNHRKYQKRNRISRPARDSLLTSNLKNWRNCLLLRDHPKSNGPALLVATVAIETGDMAWETKIDCRYIIAVREKRGHGYKNDFGRYDQDTIRFGREESEDDVDARELIENAAERQRISQEISERLHRDFS